MLRIHHSQAMRYPLNANKPGMCNVVSFHLLKESFTDGVSFLNLQLARTRSSQGRGSSTSRRPLPKLPRMTTWTCNAPKVQFNRPYFVTPTLPSIYFHGWTDDDNENMHDSSVRADG
jgi:hypothetical protein